MIIAVGLVAQPTRPQPPVPADTVRRPQQPGDTLRRPARPDTVRTKRDSVTVAAPAAVDTTRRAGIDSVRGVPDTLKTRVRRDSIQAPIARAEVPNDIGVGPLYRWTRDSVLTTGAINLSDLLERVPGVTMFRSGWIASAQTAAYLGDATRVRVFRDGVELDALDPRAGGVRDVGDIQLANIDEVTIERAAGELRVHLRTWTVRNTTPYTRVDAFTGDEDTNLYRFFYGRRFGSGFDAQVGVQQFGTGSRNRRVGGGGTVLDALARVGWARGLWSVDATLNRLDRSRDPTLRFEDQQEVLPNFESRRNDTQLRIAYGDPDGRGPWLQAIANAASQRLATTALLSLDTTFAPTPPVNVVVSVDTLRADSTFSRRQYVLTGGYRLGGVRLSATDRLRTVAGEMLNSPAVRASYDSRLFSVSVFGEKGAVGGLVVDSALVPRVHRRIQQRRVEGGTVDSVITKTTDVPGGVALPPWRASRVDVSARLSPLPWFSLLGSASRESRTLPGLAPHDTGTAVDTVASSKGATTLRLEAALRLGRMWLSGGVVRRGADTVPPLRTYGCLTLPAGGCERAIAAADSTAATGVTFGARGPVWKDVYVDLGGLAWSQAGGAYRPQLQLRSEVGVLTNWLGRFPSGNFGFKFAAIDEYRSRVRFPITPAPNTEGALLCDLEVCAPAANVLTLQLEIRIQSGVLSYQLRNALNRPYEVVPGLRMPGPINYYGVRWTFWN
ncbi:TonB-dependent receptor plug domain-containing protein [Gemmatirosa kalamazoonensis]|uniref:TonB-dependent receptor plug domain-containing protein n=1 Tax=Gemmatirosa kalamazoonensis TaxID=861299 RepID=UPI00046D3D90|nr:Plug domain-containing protein [Gemmatirosa kalamazoonensis]